MKAETRSRPLIHTLVGVGAAVAILWPSPSASGSDGRRLAGLVAVSTASSETLVFNTSDSQFTPGVDNQGWWSDTASNFDANQNYVVGQAILGGGPNQEHHLFRNFFTFDLSSLDLTGKEIVSATLEVQRYLYTSKDASETYELFDVSTPAAVLNANEGASSAIYSDLGTGKTYGSFDVGRGTRHDVESFPLNADGIADISAAAGGFFSIGGSLTTLDPAGRRFESVFGDSDKIAASDVQRLVIVTAPAAP